MTTPPTTPALVALHRTVNERRDALEQAIRDDARAQILADQPDDGPTPSVSIEYRDEPRLPPAEVFDFSAWQAREYIRTLVWDISDEIAEWGCDSTHSTPAYEALCSALEQYDAALEDSLR